MRLIHGAAALWLLLPLAGCQEQRDQGDDGYTGGGGVGGGVDGGGVGGGVGGDDGGVGGGDDGGVGGGVDGGGQPSQTADQIIMGWETVPQDAAREMIELYGEPDEMTESMLIWHQNGLFQHTIVYREEVRHDFPTPHTDVLQQFVNYTVPPDMFDDLAEFDGSVIADRTKGMLSAKCDREEANLLALNLSHQIIVGAMNVQEARDEMGRQILALANGDEAPYAEDLLFAPDRERTGDPDVSTIELPAGGGAGGGGGVPGGGGGPGGS